MDQPGSGLNAERRPLIVEQPELAHPVRRALALWFTAIAWCAWLVLWLPALTSLTEHFGVAVPWPYRSSERSLQALQQLLDIFPAAIGLVLLVLAANGVISWLYRRLHTRAYATVGTHDLAIRSMLDERSLAAWQDARILQVVHNAEGQVIGAKIVL